MQSQQQKSRPQLVVYFAHCPEHGPEHRVYDEEDIHGAGGIHAIEAEMQRETYWFARLGVIEAELSTSDSTYTYKEEAIAGLPEPPAGAWQMGRPNPSFGRGELARQIFDSLFHALAAFLETWKKPGEDGTVDAYVVKEVKINADRISSLASALTTIRRAHDIVEMTVLKYWCDPQWATRVLTQDVILDEFPLTVPVQLRWGSGEKAVVAEVLPIAYC